MKALAARFLDFLLCRIMIFITGIRPDKGFAAVDTVPKIYYANHTSHGDFLLLWVSFPYAVRRHIRPVADSVYWTGGCIRRFLAERVFNMLLIDRSHRPIQAVRLMSEALQTHSLIIFPEGTRKTNDDVILQAFKPGIFRLAAENPHLQFTPIWIHNIKNVLPKGFYVPIPLLCDINAGEPFCYAGEGKAEFLDKAKNALLALRKRSAQGVE